MCFSYWGKISGSCLVGFINILSFDLRFLGCEVIMAVRKINGREKSAFSNTKTQKIDFHNFVGSSSSGRIFRSYSEPSWLQFGMIKFDFENIISSRVYITKCNVGYDPIKVYHSNSSFFHYKMRDFGLW